MLEICLKIRKVLLKNRFTYFNIVRIFYVTFRFKFICISFSTILTLRQGILHVCLVCSFDIVSDPSSKYRWKCLQFLLRLYQFRQFRIQYLLMIIIYYELLTKSFFKQRIVNDNLMKPRIKQFWKYVVIITIVFHQMRIVFDTIRLIYGMNL